MKTIGEILEYCIRAREESCRAGCESSAISDISYNNGRREAYGDLLQFIIGGLE